MPFHSTEQGPGGSSLIDTGVLASACNDDCRFQEAGWEETIPALDDLLLDDAFRKALGALAPFGTKASLGTLVASVYGFRIKQRGSPRKSRPSTRARVVAAADLALPSLPA